MYEMSSLCEEVLYSNSDTILHLKLLMKKSEDPDKIHNLSLHHREESLMATVPGSFISTDTRQAHQEENLNSNSAVTIHLIHRLSAALPQSQFSTLFYGYSWIANLSSWWFPR